MRACSPRSGVGESAPAKAVHFGQATEGTEMGRGRSPKAAICEQRLADTNINITIMYVQIWNSLPDSVVESNDIFEDYSEHVPEIF